MVHAMTGRAENVRKHNCPACQIMLQIANLSAVTEDALDALLDDAFGPDRHSRTAYRLRRDMIAINHLSFAIREDLTLVGSIQCWPIRVANAPLILVGPVAVATNQQNKGFGKRLMQLMLTAATRNDAPMVMIGDPEYYGRFGFSAEGTAGWTLPGPWDPRRLLLRNVAKVELPSQGMLGPAD